MNRLLINCIVISILICGGNVLRAQEINAGAITKDSRKPDAVLLQQQRHSDTGSNSELQESQTASPITPCSGRILSKAELKGQFLLAIGNDDIAAVSRLIQAGAEVDNYLTKDGMTPLMLARSPGMVLKLLENGASPDRRDENGMTALHHQIFSENAETILPLLLNAGADVNAVAIGSNKETPLLAARQLFFEGGDPNRGERIIRLLSQAGAFLDEQDELGYTVLMTAVVNNKPRLAKLMLSLGANPHVQTFEGKTALDWARELHRDEIEKMLLQDGAD